MTPAAAAALAQRLISKNGSVIAIQRLSGVAADVNKPWKGAGTPTIAQSVDVSAVMVPHASTVDLGVFGVDEEMLKRVDEVLLVPGQGATDLKLFHRFSISSILWRIEWVRELRFAPLDVAQVVAFGVCR